MCMEKLYKLTFNVLKVINIFLKERYLVSTTESSTKQHSNYILYANLEHLHHGLTVKSFEF